MEYIGCVSYYVVIVLAYSCCAESVCETRLRLIIFNRSSTRQIYGDGEGDRALTCSFALDDNYVKFGKSSVCFADFTNSSTDCSASRGRGK